MHSNIFFLLNNIHLIRPERLLPSEQSEGGEQMSAKQEHESQHWEDQC